MKRQRRFGRHLAACAAASCLAPAQPGLGATQWSVSQGTQFGVALSPDGTKAVIDLQGRLWMLPASGGTALAVTDGLGDDRLPRFSPDGSWLAFQSFRGGSWDLWIARADGLEARPLTEGPDDDREPAWHPDGRRVVFASDRAGSYDIWSLDVASGETTQLTAGPHDEYAPAISTQGTLAYVSDRGGKPALWIDDGAAAPRQLPGTVGSRPPAPAFSPDGAALACVAPEEEIGFPAIARHRVAVLDLQTGEKRSVSAPDEDVFAFPPAWQGNGMVAYTADGLIRMREIAGGAARDIPFTVNFTSEPIPATPRRRIRETGKRAALGIVDPVATADKRVVFVALGDLWMRNGDASLTRLTDDAFVERDPVVSNDGRRLAFISDRSGSMQVWLRDLAEDSERQLTQVAGGVRYPALAPDGATLAFQQPGPRGDQDFTVHLLDLGSGAVRRLKAPPLWPGRMSFSGDGRRLMVAALTASSKRFRDGANRLLLLDVAGGPPREAGLSRNVSPDFGPVISPDGTQVALIIDGALALAPTGPAGDILGDAREQRAELADYPSWTADSRHIVYVGADGLKRLDTRSGAVRRLNTAPKWSPRTGAGRTLIHAGRLFDGLTDVYRRNIDIMVDGGRIAWVREHAGHPAGVKVIDASRRVVLPGLVENHAHHQGHDGEWVGRAWLAFGVTTVVEPGGLPYESRELQESWDSGARPGPRLLFAGPQLDGLRRYFPFASHVTTPRRLRWEFERARRLDYALLKTYTRMPPAVQADVISRGHDTGRIVSSHEIFPALAVGGDRVEHLRGTSRAGFSPKQSDALRSYADVIGIIARPGAAISPTLVVSGGFFSHWLAHPGLATTRQYRELWPDAYRRGLEAFVGVVGRRRALLDAGTRNARRTVLELQRAGARIVAGTDSPIFPYGLALVIELANYVEAGMPPAEALRTATSTPASALGLAEEIGTVAPGRLADLVIIDGDPLRDTADLLRVTAVLRGGRHFTLEELLRRP